MKESGNREKPENGIPTPSPAYLGAASGDSGEDKVCKSTKAFTFDCFDGRHLVYIYIAVPVRSTFTQTGYSF